MINENTQRAINGSLEWLNLRANGRLVIPESSLLAYQRISVIEKRVAQWLAPRW